MSKLQNWTEYRTIKDIQIEVNGVTRNLEVEVKIDLVRDCSYGADADGNRGVKVSVIDDWNIEAIFDLDSGENVTQELEANVELYVTVENKL